jgi:hypothetical protein
MHCALELIRGISTVPVTMSATRLSASEDIDLASLRIELTQRDSPDGGNLFASQRLVLAFVSPDEVVAAINFRTKSGQFVKTL